MLERGYSRFDATFAGATKAPQLSGSGRVYVLIDQRDETVRYVGQTRNPRLREATHRDRAAPEGNRLLRAWKHELFAAKSAPRFHVIDTTDGDLDELEKLWITHYRRLAEVESWLKSK